MLVQVGTCMCFFDKDAGERKKSLKSAGEHGGDLRGDKGGAEEFR